MRIKKVSYIFGMFLFFIGQMSHADALYSILNSSRNIEAINGNIESVAIGSLHSQWDIENLMRQVHTSMSSHSGWGGYQFHDYQSYGSGASNWNNVMQLAAGGGGGGALGQTLNVLANQFPMNQTQFNKGITDPTTQKYYAIQSQTVLATRAASQLDYDKIQDQIAYQQMLQQQIEKASDLKSAVDLNNRIQVESNLINLEILRQSALANQQQAINQQGNLNSVLLHSKFLTKSN